MNKFFTKWFPGLNAGARPRALVLESPFKEDETICIDGDDLADFFPRKVMPGTTGAVFFQGAIRWRANEYTLDGVEMVVPEAFLSAPVASKTNRPVRLSGNVLIQRDALDPDKDTMINVMSFIVLSDGNIALIPVPGVSQARPSMPAPKPRLLLK